MPKNLSPSPTIPSETFVEEVLSPSVDLEEDKRTLGVTWRTVLLSLMLAACFGYIIPIIDLQVFNTFLGGGHMPVGAIGTLLMLLLVVNPLLRVLGRRFMLSRNEALTVYITCLFSALVPGNGSESLYVSHIIGSFYYATQENRWLNFLEPYVKPWMTPALSTQGHYEGAHRAAVEAWYTGAADIPWAAWLVPLIAWGTFVFASYIMLGCFAVILRAQWGQREALSFPLLRLPLEMTRDMDETSRTSSLPAFWRNPLMWCGFGVAVFIEGINGLNFYFPEVPNIPLGINAAPLMSEAPWNQMAPFGIHVWPIFVGITYLLTAEVSFSLWFFLWFIQAQYIAAYYLGFPYGTLPAAIGHSSDGGARAFTAFQQVGGYIAYAAILLWTARAHLRHVLRRAFGRALSTQDEKNEALSYPAAFWGFAASFTFMIAWSCLAGMRLDVALCVWGLYLVTAIVLTRAVIEGGAMFINQGWVPMGTMAQLLGAGPGRWLAPNSIVPGSFMQVSFFQDMRAFLMPSFLHAFKLAHDRRIHARRLWWLIIASTLLALSLSVWMKVRMGYAAGGLSLSLWFAKVAASYPGENSAMFLSGQNAEPANWLWTALGGLFIYGLVVARSRLAWFPLHPLGYLLALTAPTQRAWFSFFLGWLLKTTITKFGGHEAYRKLVPAFLGLILGEVSMFLFWLAMDSWQGRVGHGLLP